MIRFETTIGKVGGDDKDAILLQFYSTIVAADFPEEVKFTGKELKERLVQSFDKYILRLEKRKGKEFAENESNRLDALLGKDFSRIDEAQEYEILDSVEHLSYCELPSRGLYNNPY